MVRDKEYGTPVARKDTMQKFKQFSEQILVALKPSSDSVGPASVTGQQDGFGSAVADLLSQRGLDTVDGCGSCGEIQADSEETGDVDTTGSEPNVTLGDDGTMDVTLDSGLTIKLPANVVDAIREALESTETPEDEMHVDGNATDEGTEEEVETDGVEGVEESAKTNPWAVCNASTGGKKAVGKAKFERCVKGVKAKAKGK